MQRLSIFLSLLAPLAGAAAAAVAASPESRTMASVKVVRCTTEYAVNPLGLDERRPRLGWTLESAENGQSQTACQILVASSPEALTAERADVWNSGRVASPESAHVVYGGPDLRSRTRYWWKVRVWDADGRASEWSRPAWFETGLLEASDWGARWIGAPADGDGPRPAPLLRRSFTLAGEPTRARAYVCGLGYYELTINGKRVGDHVLDPGYTRFDKRAMYATHDVTSLLRKGENVVGVTLGRGWYGVTIPNVWNFHKAPWHGEPRLLFRLEAEDEAGRRTEVVSDEQWQTHDSPTLADAIYVGDTYDARREQPGWDRPGFDASGWLPAAVLPAPTERVVSQCLEPMRVIRTLRPKAVTNPRPGTWVFDFGTNIAGWARIRVKGPADATVEIRYAEVLDDKGLAKLSNDLVSAETQIDRYTLKGRGTEVWEPRFSYKGFRYVQVDGWPGAPTPRSVEGREVHTDVASTGSFACSDPTLNALHRMTRQSLLSNYHSIPTDTPVYEKNGWLGDAHLTAETGMREFSSARFHAKWLDDIADSQREDGLVPVIAPDPGWGRMDAPEWGAAYILVTDALYRNFGDARVVERHYDRMKRYLGFLEARQKDGVSPSVLGDWLPPGYNGNPPEGPAVSAASYVYRCANVMAAFARRLGRTDDAERFEQMMERIARALNTRYLDPETGVYHTDIATGYRQATAILPLAFGITPEEHEARVLARLIEDIHSKGDHLDTGILGAAELLPLLTRHGEVDLALRIATQPTYPGWGYWVRQGATTLWEAWGDDARSRGHHMYGSIEDWFYQYLAGIRPPGETRLFVVRPYMPSALSFVRASIETMYGRVASSWRRTAGGLSLEVTVPVNTTARVEVPVSEGQTVVAPKGARRLGDAEGRTVFEVGSGRHRFRVRQSPVSDR
jgi:alpha-L-rhamnosidase